MERRHFLFHHASTNQIEVAFLMNVVQYVAVMCERRPTTSTNTRRLERFLIYIANFGTSVACLRPTSLSATDVISKLF